MTDVPALRLWRHLFGDRPDLVGLVSVKRDKKTGDWDHKTIVHQYYEPDQLEQAERWAIQQSVSREVYACVHQLIEPRRIGENAAAVLTLWADNDGGEIPEGFPQPTARLESSPGRYHDFWRLSRPIAARKAEQFNKRIAQAIGADPSGADLSQVLRIPETVNWKYDKAPVVKLSSIDDDRTIDPDHFDRILPKLPETPKASAAAAEHQPTDKPDAELLEVMFRSASGTKIKALWDDDREALATYPELLTNGAVDNNKCDLSLSNTLAFFGGTEERADTLFRQSKRMRDKWDEKHYANGQTYGQHTIEKAFEDRTSFYSPGGQLIGDMADVLKDGPLTAAAAVEAAEAIVTGASDLFCMPVAQRNQELAELARLRETNAAQQAIIREYQAMQQRELQLFASNLPPAQKLADWAILNVVASKANPGNYEQPLYADEVIRLCNVSRDTIGKRLEAQAELGVFTKRTQYDSTRTIVDETTGKTRAPLVTRVSDFVGKAEAWSIVASAAATEPARKRAPARCPNHPKAVHSLVCTVCGYVVNDQPPIDPNADYGFDRTPFDPPPDVLPIETAIPPDPPSCVDNTVLLPQASAIHAAEDWDFEAAFESIGHDFGPLPEPPEVPPDPEEIKRLSEELKRQRLEHYHARYDHAPPVDSGPPPGADAWTRLRWEQQHAAGVQT